MPELEPGERASPASAAGALSPLGAAPRIAAEPPLWEAEAPPAHMFLWLTTCDTLCLHFGGGKRGREEGANEFRSSWQNASNSIKAEVTQSGPGLPNEITSGLVQDLSLSFIFIIVVIIISIWQREPGNTLLVMSASPSTSRFGMPNGLT